MKNIRWILPTDRAQIAHRCATVVTKWSRSLQRTCSCPQKAHRCSEMLYVKGHPEFSGKGTLTVTGKVKHAIKSGEYMTVKDATIKVPSAAGDGINCGQYFLMESGVLNISGVEDNGIQCYIDDTEVGSTGETADTSSTSALKSGVTVSGGTTYFDGAVNIGGSVTGGSSVTLSDYTSSGPGGRP